jgi:hypothetical protein
MADRSWTPPHRAHADNITPSGQVAAVPPASAEALLAGGARVGVKIEQLGDAAIPLALDPPTSSIFHAKGRPGGGRRVQLTSRW